MLSRSLSTRRAAEAARGSWLCQNLVAKLKNVVEDIFISQILSTCQDTLVVMSCKEIWAGSEVGSVQARMVSMLWGKKEETGRGMNIAGLTLLLGEERRLKKGVFGSGIIRA